jgi:hypothetical protein
VLWARNDKSQTCSNHGTHAKPNTGFFQNRDGHTNPYSVHILLINSNRLSVYPQFPMKSPKKARKEFEQFC